MAFDSLTEKLQNVFKNLRSKGRLTEDDVKAALREVKMALLEADVNFKVVKNFVKSVQERAVGQDVMSGLNPGQMVIKIVNDELVNLMGSETTEIKFQPGSQKTVIMMMGLQGAGKTTTTAKLAGKFKLKGKKPLLVACDVYRPAAIKQLQINGEKQGVEVFSMGDNQKPANIAKAALEHAEKNGNNVIILDTAGRLHIDEEMMEELQEIKNTVEVHQSILVVDAMTGQDAVNVAENFKQFYPDRMASRILGMGDVLSLIEKAGEEIDEEQARKMTEKLKKSQFDFEDYLESMKQMRKMGGLGSIMNMLPGLGGMGGLGKGKMPDIDADDAEQKMARVEAIIYSMTIKERQNPDIITPQRKRRIAAGAGVDISEVNKMMKQFEQMRKMMKSFPGMMGGKGKKGKFKMPF